MSTDGIETKRKHDGHASPVNLVAYYKEFMKQCAEHGVEPNYNLFGLWVDANREYLAKTVVATTENRAVLSDEFSPSLN